MSELVLIILGIVSLIILLISLLMFALGFLYEKFKSFNESLVYEAKQNARKDLGADIIRSCYWLSESKDAETIMRVIGTHITCHPDGIFEIENVRKDWRAKRDLNN